MSNQDALIAYHRALTHIDVQFLNGELLFPEVEIAIRSLCNEALGSVILREVQTIVRRSATTRLLMAATSSSESTAVCVRLFQELQSLGYKDELWEWVDGMILLRCHVTRGEWHMAKVLGESLRSLLKRLGKASGDESTLIDELLSKCPPGDGQ